MESLDFSLVMVDNELIDASWAARFAATCVFSCRGEGTETVLGDGSGRKGAFGPDRGELTESNWWRGERRRRLSPGGGGDDGGESVGREGLAGRFLLTDRWEAGVGKSVPLIRATC